MHWLDITRASRRLSRATGLLGFPPVADRCRTRRFVLAVPGCIYHEQVTIRKPLTLDGQGTAEIRGSDVWSAWSQGLPVGFRAIQYRPSLSTIRAAAPTAAIAAIDPNKSSKMARRWPRLSLRYRTWQWPVRARREPPRDRPRRSGRARNGGQHARPLDRYPVRQRHDPGFQVLARGEAAETGSIGNQSRNGWTLQDSKLYYAHGGIVSLGGASNPNTQTRVLRNEIGGSGYEAINGYLNTNTLIQGNTMFNNNLSASTRSTGLAQA